MAIRDDDGAVAEAVEARDSARFLLIRLGAAIEATGNDRLVQIFEDFESALGRREEALSRLL